MKDEKHDKKGLLQLKTTQFNYHHQFTQRDKTGLTSSKIRNRAEKRRKIHHHHSQRRNWSGWYFLRVIKLQNNVIPRFCPSFIFFYCCTKTYHCLLQYKLNIVRDICFKINISVGWFLLLPTFPRGTVFISWNETPSYLEPLN